MATTLHGERTWSGERDAEGYRTYLLVSYVRSDTGEDGPANVLQTPGLALPGAMWAFFDDVDPWVWCRPTARITPHENTREGNKVIVWRVEQEFSNKPLDGQDNKCQDQSIDDPSLEPPKISLNYQQFQEIAKADRFGKPVTTSSHEKIDNPTNEWDASRTSVVMEQNVLLLQPGLLEAVKDTVNDAPLWGFPARWIKCRVEAAEEHYYGLCYKYYTRRFCFEIREGGWDRDLLDEGTKVLHGHWGVGSGSGCAIDIGIAQGSGCTVTVVSVDGSGRIEELQLASGGTGYPANSDVNLEIGTGDPTPFCIGVTDASGVVVRIIYRGDAEFNFRGLGCTVGTKSTIHTDLEGAITSASVSSGGSGYPESSTFPLKIVSGEGQGGVVIVSSDSSGVVTTYKKISSGGRGYVSATANTAYETGWILDDIDGDTPDPNNPAHFDRATDRYGNPQKVVLDGGGCPVNRESDAARVHVEKYRGANFFLLGIPAVIGP